MDNRNKIIGIATLIIIILVAALAFYNYKGFHSVDTSTNASVPTEVASPPEGGS
ncbi:hypothetical protein Lbir_1096 [Legionella birminghamensis]|uniref:Uncharacterized protein n=1 Tax=Legionella birminghamensis TaxID=28083 RepID=A0A378IB31_9GAMM|nr:hypothetical protein [Legionella birminghamensis]KTC73044.1 hypothetical protein Lbir_1096 [Legionella birminghamensis]STX32379.1 Uncharacterised protein [Legionella birminghamensis]